MRLDERGHDLGMVTSSTRPEAEAVLRFLQVQDVFDAVVTAEDVSEGKPSPQPYLLASAQLRRPSSECVVVEDSPSGVASAKKAGMRCVAIASTHDPDVLSEADVVVDTIDGLDSDSRVVALL
jgi:hypothetical protein